MLNNIVIIAFDLDDTLWPCQPVIEYAEETLYLWLAEHYPRITDRYSRQAILEKRKAFTLEKPEYQANFTLMRHAFLNYVGKEAGYDASEVEHKGFEAFFHARQQVSFYDDVMPGLERLKQNYRLGSISNGNASVEHVGLGSFFEHSVSAADLNVAKPDQRIFHHFAERCEVDPHQVLYVGDHPHYDVVGPEQAGMPAVWVNREQNKWPDDLPAPRHEIDSLYQLEALLNEFVTS